MKSNVPLVKKVHISLILCETARGFDCGNHDTLLSKLNIYAISGGFNHNLVTENKSRK
jgi:hypothetical protein